MLQGFLIWKSPGIYGFEILQNSHFPDWQKSAVLEIIYKQPNFNPHCVKIRQNQK